MDVSPLAGLVNLTGSGLNNNQIVDVSPLAGLVNLTRLYLNNNQIVDVSPLAGLVNLTDQIVDSLAGSLISLPLWKSNRGRVTTGRAHQSQGLYLGGNPIVDTSPLRSLPLKTKIHGVSVSCRCCTIV